MTAVELVRGGIVVRATDRTDLVDILATWAPVEPDLTGLTVTPWGSCVRDTGWAAA